MALVAASCVVAELEVDWIGLGATALVLAGRALQTLRLGEWMMPWASCDQANRCQ